MYVYLLYIYIYIYIIYVYLLYIHTQTGGQRAPRSGPTHGALGGENDDKRGVGLDWAAC